MENFVIKSEVCDDAKVEECDVVSPSPSSSSTPPPSPPPPYTHQPYALAVKDEPASPDAEIDVTSHSSSSSSSPPPSPRAHQPHILAVKEAPASPDPQIDDDASMEDASSDFEIDVGVDEPAADPMEEAAFAELVAEMEAEEAEEEDNAAVDSGVGSINSDAETIEREDVDDALYSMTSSDDDDDDQETEEEEDVTASSSNEDVADNYHEMQAELLQRLLVVKTRFWHTMLAEVSRIREEDISDVHRRIAAMRGARRRPARLQNNRPLPQRRRHEDRPVRHEVSCAQCLRVFYVQRVRLWIRCDNCGGWLCPDCSSQLHC